MYNTIQKTIAAWAFNHYIAYYYFDNVNVGQLKVAFEKGEVELENLPIKKDALQHFKLPMDVVSGIVGRLSIKVPLLTLLTDPWSIKISNIMLIVAPKKQQQSSNANGNAATNSTPSAADESFSTLGDQSHLDLLPDTSDANLADCIDSSNLYNNSGEPQADCFAKSEETKLAEFYSSFSASVSATVRDIYKNIRLEVESMTILFQDFDNGLVKFSVDSLLLHRPKSVRNLFMENISIHLSNSIGTPNIDGRDDLLKIKLEKCNLDIHDEASNNMQLVLAKQQDSSVGSDSSLPKSTPSTTSETRIEGNFDVVSVEHLSSSVRRGGIKKSTSKVGEKTKDDLLRFKRSVLKCDTLKMEFKLNINSDDELTNSSEKNLHLKLDLVGMQYIHSQQIYEIMIQRLRNLVKFIVKLQGKQPDEMSQLTPRRRQDEDENGSFNKNGETILNKLLVINIEDGLLYVVDDTSSSCAIPLLEFTLRDCRIFWISSDHQQNGFVFAKVGCNYYNREVSTWDILLHPWPFNLSLDLKRLTVSGKRSKRDQNRQITLSSDEKAEFVLSSAFLDLGDIALKRVIDDILHHKLWPIATCLGSSSRLQLSQEFNSIFVLHNETGHKLHFAPIEQISELHEINDSPKYSVIGLSGDSSTQSFIQKFPSQDRSSSSSRDSPDLNGLVRWITVDAGDSLSFDYETLPIYRRHISDPKSQSRVLLVRVEGWKTLLPIPIDKTGLFFREASSDRVMNEDTHLVISIELEDSSARKIISVRSPLNLVNQLDATLEVHFLESDQSLFIKPDCHLSVPLPYLYDRMQIRPFNAGVTMSKQALLWDDVRRVFESESKVHICHPITVTNQKHASYCTSLPFRVCVSTQRDWPRRDDIMHEPSPYDLVPVYTMSFIPPLTIVNLLPCKIQYFIGEINGSLNMGFQQKIFHVNTTRPTEVHFKMNGFPQSKGINIDPGATGDFHHTLEMFDKMNRSLYLNAKIILSSYGEDPAIQVIIYAPFWFINKTRLPIIFKQEGAAMEAAGQFREHEDSSMSPLLFSFYDTELEPPWRCIMRLGKSKGTPQWSDSFILEKGRGEKKLYSIPKENDSKFSKSLIDINIRRGFGRYSGTMIVTFTARYGFDPLTKTPKKASIPSPQNYKLTSYNHNTNLAERIASLSVNLFDNYYNKGTSTVSVKVPGFKLTLVDDSREKLIEASVTDIVLICTTKTKEQIVDCSVQDICIENAMVDCEKDVVLDRASVPGGDRGINVKPAIRLIMDRIVGNSMGTTLFRQVQLSMCELVLNIEEKLVLKLIEFISFRNRRRQRKNMNNLTHDLDRILHPEEDRLSKYYFDLLRIDLSSLKLSVFTSPNLTNPLQKLKSYLGLKFFGFEEAQVQLSPYFKMNLSNTFSGVFDSVTRFYKRQILEQAPRIVGQQIQNYLRFHLSDLLSTLYDDVYNKLFN